MNRHLLTHIVIAALVLAMSLGGPQPVVHAGGVVGTGTAVSCNEGALASALAGGGTVTFNCGPTTATITLTSAKTISQDTTLEGADLITLSGQNTTRIFNITNGAVLTLRSITLTNGFSANRGGAIFNGGQPADPHGSLIMDGATIRSSQAAQGGGAIITTGPVTLTNSSITENLVTDTAPGSGLGGGILAVGGAQIAVSGTTISTNTAERGGGVYLATSATLTMTGGQLYLNTARSGGGGLLNEGGTATLTDTTVRGNDAQVFGGGLVTFGGTTTLSEVTVLGNTSVDGAGAYSGTGAGSGDTSQLTLTNVTFSGNLASGKGGGVYGNSGTITAQHVTVSGNRSGAGSAGLFQSGGTFSVRAVIVGGNLSAGNCQGTFVNAGFNFATDGTCAGFAQVADLKLSAFGYGPYGLAYLPEAGSPAIGAVSSGCPPPTRDQRGQTRPQGGACEAGAVEVATGPALLRLLLPALLRQ